MKNTHFLREKTKKILLPIFVKFNVNPKFLLVFRIIFAFVTGVSLFFNNYISSVFLIIYQFVFLLDYVDGPLARAKGQFSSKLNKVDRIAHSLTTFLFLLAITYAYFLPNMDLPILVAGLLGSLFVLSSAMLEVLWMNRGLSFERLKEMHKVSGSRNFLFYNFLRIDGPFTLFFFLVILNLNMVAIILFSAIHFLIFIKKVYNLAKWRKKK